MGNEDDQYWNKYKISRGNKEYIKEIRNPIKQLKREIYLLKEYLKYYGVDLWIEGYVLFVNMNSPVESEYTVNDKSEIDDILHLRRNQVLTKNQIEKIISILKYQSTRILNDDNAQIDLLTLEDFDKIIEKEILN